MSNVIGEFKKMRFVKLIRENSGILYISLQYIYIYIRSTQVS
jgi:hypothetical protein